MSTAPPPPQPNSKPAPAAVIRHVEGAHETSQERLLKKIIPAFVASGALHVFFVGMGLLLSMLGFFKQADAAASDRELTVAAEEVVTEEKQPDLTNPDLGLDSELPAALENDNVQEVNVETPVVQDAPPGVEEATATAKVDFIPPPGVGTPGTDPGVAEGPLGSAVIGTSGGGSGIMANPGFNGRSGATKSALVAAGGGNSASEAAVARGLAWLAKQQKANGSWEYDGTNKGNRSAATGMALLPFLAAGCTHKVGNKENKYQKNVEAGLRFLFTQQKPDGSFSHNMYEHGIATVAICEALGMTGDRGLLLSVAQKAVNFMQGAQGSDGSWGYGPGANGDTSIVGWQIQALQSAKLCKDLVVDKEVLVRANKFLDSVSAGSNKSQYGYRTPGSSLTLTPVGLLCRYYSAGWGPQHPGLATGVEWMQKARMPNKAQFDMYYYYYATQVMHFFEGEAWHKKWNPQMRDMLLGLQVPEGKGANSGSWDADTGSIGTHCGRVGTTCLCLLTLEVYYRHLPLYKRDQAGLKELERVK